MNLDDYFNAIFSNPVLTINTYIKAKLLEVVIIDESF